MKESNDVIIQPGYYRGYAEGFNEGFNEAFKQYEKFLLTAQNPKIIVTTQENVERLKREYNIEHQKGECRE